MVCLEVSAFLENETCLETIRAAPNETTVAMEITVKDSQLWTYLFASDSAEWRCHAAA